MTVTVPGLCQGQEIAKRTGRKVQIPQVYKARQLAGRVDAIWTNLDHITKNYFDFDTPRVVQHARTPTTTCTHTVATCSATCARCLPKLNERSLPTSLGRFSKPTAFA